MKFDNAATALAKNDAILSYAFENSGKTMRLGKTARDRARNAGHRNTLNKGKRADWRNRVKSSKASNEPFPFETCAGQRHRPASFKAPRPKRKRA